MALVFFDEFTFKQFAVELARSVRKMSFLGRIKTRRRVVNGLNPYPIEALSCMEQLPRTR
jgi:hypothetical protein